QQLAVPLRERVVPGRIFHAVGSVALALEYLRVDQTGAENGHADAALGELAPQRGGEADDGVLARSVWADRRRIAQSGGAGGADDMARTLLGEQWSEYVDTVDDAAQVDVQHPVPDVERRIENRPARCDARVETDEVRGSEAGQRLVAQSLHVLDRTNVALHAHDAIALATQLVDGRVDRTGLDVADRDAHARGREAVGE